MKLRNTPARSSILKFLEESKSPVDVSQIIEHLRSKKLRTNKVTVYRTLETLVENGQVQKLEFGEGKFRYEIKREDHHHLICTKCSRIQDFEDNYMEKLEKEVLKNRNFKVNYHSLELFGVCSKHK